MTDKAVDLYGFDWIPMSRQPPEKDQHILRRFDLRSGKLSEPVLNYYNPHFEASGYVQPTVEWFPVPATD